MFPLFFIISIWSPQTHSPLLSNPVPPQDAAGAPERSEQPGWPARLFQSHLQGRRSWGSWRCRRRRTTSRWHGCQRWLLPLGSSSPAASSRGGGGRRGASLPSAAGSHGLLHVGGSPSPPGGRARWDVGWWGEAAPSQEEEGPQTLPEVKPGQVGWLEKGEGEPRMNASDNWNQSGGGNKTTKNVWSEGWRGVMRSRRCFASWFSV